MSNAFPKWTGEKYCFIWHAINFKREEISEEFVVKITCSIKLIIILEAEEIVDLPI